MKTGWILAAGVGIVIIALVISKRPIQAQHPIIPPKTKIPRNSYIPVSLQPPVHNYGSCTCIHDVLSGPQCKLAGKSCSDVKKILDENEYCTCVGGIITAVDSRCPSVGQPCQIDYNPNPAHVHTTCPKGSYLMGTTCVKEYGNPDISLQNKGIA